ncbi:MAG: DUF924 domain-containing protein [Rhodobacteraceae bacterium]|nr:DUF924 domain-containing protein [Paracoccaceae bacterium]
MTAHPARDVPRDTVAGAAAAQSEAAPEAVLEFWFHEVGPKGWFEGGPELDKVIRDRFETLWERARRGRLGAWRRSDEGVLGLILLLDQFPRNMFRDGARAFASDGVALALAKQAIDHSRDLRSPEEQRPFFYLPLMHSESLPDQERCVRLFRTRLPGAVSNLLHARAHREVIRRFGRFPYRNAALGRESTPVEKAFMTEGGYGAVLRALEAD